jgi:hypothetical protein
MGKYVAVFALLGWLGCPGAALAAENLSIAAFYGTWKGTGQVHSPDDTLAMTARDLDVKIAPQGAGFRIAWTTVSYLEGGAGGSEVRRKSSTLDFLPSGRPGVFKAASAGDPFAGDAFSWARIKGQTLTVYLLNIREDGAYDMQSYARTLTGFAMDLTFTRVRDDEPQRSARGKLIKLSD